jgi:acetyl esterase/lipase
MVEQFGLQTRGLSGRQRLERVRRYMDQLGRGRTYNCTFSPADAGGVPAEWVRAPGTDSTRRVLFLHGGAFFAGSPVSHRNITTQFAERTGAAVLAIDYRLMPEHLRIDGIEDCRTAYRWILENGPEGLQPISHLVVSGDSAGGNLALSLTAWVRDQGLRQPDAVVALSPIVDSTLSSPSIVSNAESDVMLGPMFKLLKRTPPWIRRWVFLLANRINPANPLVSPVFGNLSGLPPTLIQVSEVEMLQDDAHRYVNKARSAGTHAVVQSWGHMMHVWHIFYPEVREAGEAWDEIVRFLDSTRLTAAS